MTPQDPGQPISEIAEEQGAKKGFFATPTGRIVTIVVAVLVFLGIASAVALFAFGFFVKNQAEDMLTDVVKQASSQVTTGVAGSETATGGPAIEPAAIAPQDIFTFRDIFDPLIKPPVEESATETSTITDPEGDTLYLEDITSEDGAAVAVMLYNGTEYRLKVGGTIPDTPWQVLSIGDTSVVMLYGDSQVTLSIGQGTSK